MNDLNLIFKVLPAAALILEPQNGSFIICEVNDACKELINAGSGSLTGKEIFEIFPFNDSAHKVLTDELRSSLGFVMENRQESRMKMFRRYQLSESVREKFLSIINTPVKDEKGEVLYILLTISDETQNRFSESENTLLLNNTEEGFVLVDTDLKIISFNQQYSHLYEQLLGKPVNKGQSILDYTRPERAEALKAIYESVFRGAEEESEVTIPLPDGSFVCFALKYKPARDEHQKIAGAFISAIDITDIKKAQLQLEAKERRYRALVENGSDAVVIRSTGGKPSYVSPSIHKVIGYTEAEAMELDHLEMVHPDDREGVKAAFRKALASPGVPVKGITSRMKHKDGSWHWYTSTITNFLNDEAIGGIVENIRDVTEKVDARRELRENEKRYRYLFHNNPQPMYISNVETLAIMECNDAILEKYGYTREEFLALSVKDIHWGEDLTLIEEAGRRENGFSKLKQKVWRQLKKNGELMYMEVTRNLIDFKGVKASLVVVNDVTGKLKAEEQKAFEKRDKEALINSTDDLIWSVSRSFKLMAANKAFLEKMKGPGGVEIKPGDNLMMEDIFPADSLPFWRKAYDRALTGVPLKEELYTPAYGDEPESWMEISFNPVFKSDTLVGIACFARNITERKLFEFALLESEEKYKQLFHLSPIPMWVYDLETLKFLDVNKAAVKHYQFSRDEFLKMDISEIRPIEDIPLMKEAIENMRNTERKFTQSVFRHRKKNGEIMRVEIQGNLINYNGKKAELILASDITERASYISAIEQQNKTLQDIAWIQSHVVRAPLARMMGLINISGYMDESEMTKEELMQLVVSSAHELDAIIRDITNKTEQINLGGRA